MGEGKILKSDYFLPLDQVSTQISGYRAVLFAPCHCAVPLGGRSCGRSHARPRHWLALTRNSYWVERGEKGGGGEGNKITTNKQKGTQQQVRIFLQIRSETKMNFVQKLILQQVAWPTCQVSFVWLAGELQAPISPWKAPSFSEKRCSWRAGDCAERCFAVGLPCSSSTV